MLLLIVGPIEGHRSGNFWYFLAKSVLRGCKQPGLSHGPGFRRRRNYPDIHRPRSLHGLEPGLYKQWNRLGSQALSRIARGLPPGQIDPRSVAIAELISSVPLPVSGSQPWENGHTRMKFVEIIAPPSRYPPAGECAPACLASTGGGLVLLGHAQARPHAFRTKERFQFGIDPLNLVTIAVLLFAISGSFSNRQALLGKRFPLPSSGPIRAFATASESMLGLPGCAVAKRILDLPTRHKRGRHR